MTYQLPGRLPRITETEAEADIVQARLEQLEHDISSNPAPTGSFVEAPAELLFQDTVLKLELLLLAQGDGVIRFLATTGAQTMLPGRIVAALECAGGSKQRYQKSAADSVLGSSITCHVEKRILFRS